MRLKFIVSALALLAVGVSTKAALITEWNCNAASPNHTNASTGTGSFLPYKLPGASATQQSFTQGSVGTSIDPVTPSTSNKSLGILGLFGAAGSENGLRGAAGMTSTAGYANISVKFDLYLQARASRFWQLMFTSDGGTTWSKASGGTATAVMAASNTTNASLTSGGLLTLQSNVATANTTSFSQFTYTLPLGSVYEDKPGFGFFLAAVFDTARNDYVTTSTNQTAGDSTTTGYSTAAGMRFDMMSVSGTVPEPGTITGLGMLSGLSLLRRRKSRD